MNRRRWLFDHWGTPVELRLEPATPGEEDTASWVRWRLGEWLRDESAAAKLDELYAQLGGRFPRHPDRWSLAAYREELQRSIGGALERGRITAVVERGRGRGAGVAPAAPERRPLDPVQESGGLSLVVRTTTGLPVVDDAGFLLVHPDGREEPAKLDGGRFERTAAPRGAYRARFRHLRAACWSSSAIHCGDEVELSVQAPSFEDGTQVRFEVRERWSPLGEPVARLEAAVRGGAAAVTWRHVQGPGGPARAEYVFEAAIGAKSAWSDPLAVEPHPSSSYAGVKERLVQLGYAPGAPGPESTPELESAVKEFQGRCGFPEPNGRCDDATVAMLEALT